MIRFLPIIAIFLSGCTFGSETSYTVVSSKISTVSVPKLELSFDLENIIKNTELGIKKIIPITNFSPELPRKVSEEEAKKKAPENVLFLINVTPSFYVAKQKDVNNSEDKLKITDWLSAGFATLAALLSIVTIVITIVMNNRARKQSINDQYWMREVIYPACLQPVTDFVRDAKSHYEASGNDLAVFFDSYALERMNQIRDTFMLSVAISPVLSNNLGHALDDLEDAFDNVTQSHELTICLTVFLGSVIQLLKNAQEEIS